MVTPLQQEAIDKRNAWVRKSREAFKAFEGQLLELMQENFAHQIGPRGVESYKAFEEVVEETFNDIEAMRTTVQARFMVWYSDEERKRRRTSLR